MRGRKPVRPLSEIADAAVRVFADKGFRPAGISDVSAALGFSHGAVYTYVDSKQAMLYLALLRVTQPDAVNALTIPVTEPPPAELIALAEAWAKGEVGMPRLAEAGAGPSGLSIEEELGGVVDELYDFVERNQRVLRLVAQCAAALPELAQWYFVGRRRAMLAQLAEFLRRRIDAGQLRPVPDVPVAARFIVETIAWFAMHRHGDPDSAMLDDEASSRTVKHLLRAAFLATPSETTPDATSETGPRPGPGPEIH